MVLKSENKKVRLTMNKLPDEIILSILSRLPMNDAARAGLVSRKWHHYWHHIQVLNFDDPIKFKEKMEYKGRQTSNDYLQVVKKGRCYFVNWVNNVLSKHVGCVVNEFKVVWFLTATHKHVIDTWIFWAFSKHVEKFQLDFSFPRVTSLIPDAGSYVLDLPILKSCCNTKFNLTSLCLKYVNVTTQAMEYILHTCGPTLDYLSIENCRSLTSITDASLPSLRYFKLHGCPNVQTIHIQAPKLVTFKYFEGSGTVLSLLNIENASMLSRVSVHVRDEDRFFRILSSLFKYFSHLEYLKLSWFKLLHISRIPDNFPALASLKHLKLYPSLLRNRTLDAWIPFIGACPLLQKLTLRQRGQMLPELPKIECHAKCPLLYLKTFEIKIFNGYNVDIDIANFVLQNAPSLQEVILYISRGALLLPLNLEAPFAGVCLKLPPHVNLVIV